MPEPASPVHVYGHHRVQAGDVMRGLDTLMHGDSAAVFYSDPPWGPGMMTYFQGLVRKQGVTDVLQPDYRALLDALLLLAARHTTGPIFIEYGERWADDVVAAGTGAGCAHLATFNGRYTSAKRPQHIHLFAPPGLVGAPLVAVAHDLAYRAALEEFTGVQAVVAALKPFVVPNGIVLDPCCGFGLVGKAAVRLGMRFYGNELNAQRLAPCCRWLQREVNA